MSQQIIAASGLGRRGRAGRGLPRPEPGAGSAGQGAAAAPLDQIRLNSAAQCGVDVRRRCGVETRPGRTKAREQAARPAGVRWIIVCCALAGL
jgi:hypothetical protein